MSVVLDRPYRFVPPHRGDAWPSFIQRFRLVDRYLAAKEGVVDYEARHLERWVALLERGDGILLAPNHCRYADPLVLGWPAREAKTHLFAMASWHLFNKGRFDRFAIQKMGGFSVWREGPDRQAIEMAIDLLVEARRPLIIFPEGTTQRTNDRVRPLMEGVSFIARTAARRRQKSGSGRVVVLPVAIKYLFAGDLHRWAQASLERLEQRLLWRPRTEVPVLHRIARVLEGYLTTKEVEHLGRAGTGPAPARRDALVRHLVEPIEEEYGGVGAEQRVLARIWALRPKIVPRLFDPQLDRQLAVRLRRQVADLTLAQQLNAYPEGYLEDKPLTDTRVLESLEQLEEDVFGKSRHPERLKAIIEFGEAIEVPADRLPRGEPDTVLAQTHAQLTEMVERLAREAQPLRPRSLQPLRRARRAAVLQAAWEP